MWFLWKARNDLRFNKKEWKVSHVLHAVKADIHISHTITQELQNQPSAPTQPQNTAPPHNNTLPPFPGTRCYVDAAITPDAQRSNPRQAGLGILIQGAQQTTLNNVFIQAVTDLALNPLQAETHALMLASAIIKTLEINQVQYLTDSKLLATTLHKQDPVTQAADWRTRPLIADFLCNSEQANFTVIKIPRQRNSTAHDLAAQARSQADLPACLFACNNANHLAPCHVHLALQSIHWGNYRLISVSCI